MSGLPWTCLVCLALFLSASTGRQSTNSPPVVELLTPVNNSTFDSGAMVSYAISVSDKEDGESRFDEIPSDKIFLEIRFSPTSSRDAEKSLVNDNPGLAQLRKSDCFTCHQFRGQFIGPSFTEIAKRYANNKDAEAILAASIQRGSQKVWGKAIMPAHAEITDREAGEIAAWILQAGIDDNLNYLAGKEGAFRLTLPPKAGPGYFILKATYADSGLHGEQGRSLVGYDTAVIGLQ